MSDTPDLDASITIARDDLRQLSEAVGHCWDIDLDRLRGGVVDTMEFFEREPGYEHAAHPNLRRSNVRAIHGHDGSAVARRAPWNPPGKASVERAYVEATREVARAHWELLHRTEWGDTDPATCGAVWIPGRVIYVLDLSQPSKPEVPITADQARVVPLDEMRRAITGLSLGLKWARSEYRAGNLMVPERHGVQVACDHARAALKRIPDGLRGNREPVQIRRCKRQGCQGEDGLPRPLKRRDGKVCEACRARDYRAKKAS